VSASALPDFLDRIHRIQQDADKKFIHGFPGPHRFKKRNLRKSPASRSPARLLRNLRICSAPFAGRHGRRYSFQFIDFKYEKLILRLYLKKRGSRVAESPAPVLRIVWLLTASSAKLELEAP
jgi:hypothetical protein